MEWSGELPESMGVILRVGLNAERRFGTVFGKRGSRTEVKVHTTNSLEGRGYSRFDTKSFKGRVRETLCRREVGKGLRPKRPSLSKVKRKGMESTPFSSKEQHILRHTGMSSLRERLKETMSFCSNSRMDCMEGKNMERNP